MSKFVSNKMGDTNWTNNFSKPSNFKISSMDSSPYLQSLKLKDMPDFKNKLKEKSGTIKDERVTDVRDFGYNKNVLVGNWFEERKHKHIRHVNTYSTTYNAEYKPPSRYCTEGEQMPDMKLPTSKCNGQNENVKKSSVADKTCSMCDNSASKGRCMYYTEYTKSYVPYKLTKTNEEIINEMKKLRQCIKGDCFFRQAMPVHCTNTAKA